MYSIVFRDTMFRKPLQNLTTPSAAVLGKRKPQVVFLDTLPQTTINQHFTAPAATKKTTVKTNTTAHFQPVSNGGLPTPVAPGPELLLNLAPLSTSEIACAESDTSVRFQLPDFGYDKKQTLRMKLHVPPEAKFWSFDICPEKDRAGSNVFMHFNPRYAKNEQHSNQIVVTDKQGTWGRPCKTTMPEEMLHTRDVTVIVEILNHGFFVYCNGVLVALFKHRRNPTMASICGGSYDALTLRFASHDDQAHKQTICIKEVHWGRCSRDNPMHNVTQRFILYPHPAENNQVKRTVIIRGLPKTEDRTVLHALEYSIQSELIENELTVQACNAVPGIGIAFVRVSTSDCK